MTTEIVTQADHQKIDQDLEWLTRLPQLRPGDLPAMQEVTDRVAALTHPCHPTWCMARVAALLNPYYDKDTPQMVREMEAEDWMEALEGYPQWAVERAARWWKSADNPDRRKKPLEGDIAARCRSELRGIKSLPEILRRKAEGQYFEPSPPRQKETTAERRAIAARVMAETGVALKKFGGAAE